VLLLSINITNKSQDKQMLLALPILDTGLIIGLTGIAEGKKICDFGAL
jgi:hypothetical protein